MSDELRGPPDDVVFPERLETHVVSGGTEPRIHGYSVVEDLARSFTFAELVLTALAGEAPSREVGRVFEVAMMLMAPVEARQGAAHAAILARICGAEPAAVTGVAAIGLAQQCTGRNEVLADDVAAIRALLPVEARVVVEDGMTPGEACEALLDHCGLTDERYRVAVRVIARLPVVLAEAFAHEPGSFRDYPTHHTPPFRYSEG